MILITHCHFSHTFAFAFVFVVVWVVVVVVTVMVRQCASESESMLTRMMMDWFLSQLLHPMRELTTRVVWTPAESSEFLTQFRFV